MIPDHSITAFLSRKPGERVLVTGGRTNYNWLGLWQALDALEPSLVIEGGATGWDEGAYRWVEYHRARIKTVNAPWTAIGVGAGILRNRYMLEHFAPDLVLAGEGGRGTLDCCYAATALRIPVFRVLDDYSRWYRQ